jgi:integrase
MSWALNQRGLITANPFQNGGRLYGGSRADKIWSHDDEALFIARAPKHLHLPLILGLRTGQQQGDLLRLTWSAYAGSHIRLRQSKTGARVVIKVGSPPKAVLDATPRQSPLILLNSDNKPWTSSGFRSSWRNACAAAGIVGVTFNNLRGTAVIRLAIAECTVPESATITGHSLRMLTSSWIPTISPVTRG